MSEFPCESPQVDRILIMVRGCSIMIQEYSQRIFSVAVVCLWVVVVSATFAMIWAGTVNGGISW
jgi:hypothetical protein